MKKDNKMKNNKLNEGTIQDIKDEIGQRIYDKKFQDKLKRENQRSWMDRIKGRNKVDFDEKDRTHFYRLLTKDSRQKRLQRDGKVAGATAAVGIGGAALVGGAMMLRKRNKIKKWKREGCDNIVNKKERTECLNYINRI